MVGGGARGRSASRRRWSAHAGGRSPARCGLTWSRLRGARGSSARWRSLATFDPAAVLVGRSRSSPAALCSPSSCPERPSWWRWVGPARRRPGAALDDLVVAGRRHHLAGRRTRPRRRWPCGPAGRRPPVCRGVRRHRAGASEPWLPRSSCVDGDDRWTALALVVAAVVGLGVALFAVRDDLASLVRRGRCCDARRRRDRDRQHRVDARLRVVPVDGRRCRRRGRSG